MDTLVHFDHEMVAIEPLVYFIDSLGVGLPTFPARM